MENINKQIYTLPEIRRITKPLWAGWIITAIGAVCGCISAFCQNISSDLIYVTIIGVLSLLLTLCYYLFGDSRRPYHKELHTILEPEIFYFAYSEQQQLLGALESNDEKALASIKRVSQPQLILVRFSDKAETIYYSQLLRSSSYGKYEPLSDIFINNLNK